MANTNTVSVDELGEDRLRFPQFGGPVGNNGGEVHTFTEVANFGAGVVPPLNAALPAGTPPAQPIGPFNGLAAGETVEFDRLSTGTHLFECLIHPWMRTVAEQN